MSHKVILEWGYKPKNFLEAPHKIDFKGSEIKLEGGNIMLEITKEIYDSDPKYSNNVETFIKKYLDGISIESHTSYTLLREATKVINEDGKIVGHTLVAQKISHSVSIGGNVDFVVRDKNGNVTHDSKKERIENKKAWGNLITKIPSQDQALKDIYLNSIEDPKNELIYLYEILDYVGKKFGGKREARKKLSIRKKDWNLLKEIANNRPLREGRHRGQNADNLRNATLEELQSARRISKEIIRQYLKLGQSNSE